jgi:diphthamide synthase subunit DPH2
MVEIERSSVCDLVFMDVYWEWYMPLLSPHQLASLVTFQEKKKKKMPWILNWPLRLVCGEMR